MPDLRQLERGERIMNAKTEAKADGVATQRTKRPWLRGRISLDIDEPAIDITPGDAPPDLQ